MGSRRLVVAAAKIMAVQRKRWIRTGATWAVRVTEDTPRAGQRRRGARKGITGNGGRAAKNSQGHRAWPVVLAVHLPLTAGEDDGRRLSGHEWGHPNAAEWKSLRKARAKRNPPLLARGFPLATALAASSLWSTITCVHETKVDSLWKTPSLLTETTLSSTDLQSKQSTFLRVNCVDHGLKRRGHDAHHGIQEHFSLKKLHPHCQSSDSSKQPYSSPRLLQVRKPSQVITPQIS